MSSFNTSTLCRNKLHQCEGFVSASDDVCTKIGQNLCFREGAAFQRLHASSPFLDPSQYNVLDRHSLAWDLDKPVLVDKLFPREPGYTKLVNLAVKSGIPSIMKSRGIEQLHRAHIFVWTPLCAMPLHSTVFRGLNPSQNDTKKAEAHWSEELHTLERMKQQHSMMLREGIPVLIVNYANLLFNETKELKRITEFLPCIDDINTKFVPAMGVDVFEGNSWKVKGSLNSFAKSKNPFDCCGYDVVSSTCMDHSVYESFPQYSKGIEKIDSYFLGFTK
jgi:hypothetical protein